MNFVKALREDPERQAFVIKVYAIVAAQLSVSVIGTGYVLSSEDAQEWMKDHIYLHFVAIVVGIALLCAIHCCKNNARIVPRNYILLGLFTICWSYMVAGFAGQFEPEIVFMAAALTFAMFIGLTLFACFCKMRMTVLWGIAAAGTIAVWPMIIFFWIFPSKAFYNVLCFFIVILTSIYIIFDTKLIMGYLSVDEYIIGALILYVDIVQLFIYLLSLLGNN